MRLKYPERLLQPWKDLRQFTQELYAMFKDGEEDDVSGGIDVEAPPVKIGEQSFKVQRRQDGELSLVPAQAEPKSPPPPPEGRRRFTSPARRPREPEGRVRAEPEIEERRQAAAERPKLPEPGRQRREAPAPAEQDAGRPLPQFDAAPAFRDRKADLDLEPTRREPAGLLRPARNRPTEADAPARKPPEIPRYEGDFQEATTPPKKRKVVNVGTDVDYPPPALPGGGGGGTTVFIGKVTGKSGSNAVVVLYPDGPAGDPGDQVNVQIQDLDSGDSVPNGWLYGIFLFTDADGNDTYSAKPPMWLA